MKKIIKEQLIKDWNEKGDAIKASWGTALANDVGDSNISEQIQHLHEFRHEYYYVLQLSEQDIQIIEFISDLKESFIRLLALKTQDPTGHINDGHITG